MRTSYKGRAGACYAAVDMSELHGRPLDASLNPSQQHPQPDPETHYPNSPEEAWRLYLITGSFEYKFPIGDVVHRNTLDLYQACPRIYQQIPVYIPPQCG